MGTTGRKWERLYVASGLTPDGLSAHVRHAQPHAWRGCVVACVPAGAGFGFLAAVCLCVRHLGGSSGKLLFCFATGCLFVSLGQIMAQCSAADSALSGAKKKAATKVGPEGHPPPASVRLACTGQCMAPPHIPCQGPPMRARLYRSRACGRPVVESSVHPPRVGPPRGVNRTFENVRRGGTAPAVR